MTGYPEHYGPADPAYHEPPRYDPVQYEPVRYGAGRAYVGRDWLPISVSLLALAVAAAALVIAIDVSRDSGGGGSSEVVTAPSATTAPGASEIDPASDPGAVQTIPLAATTTAAQSEPGDGTGSGGEGSADGPGGTGGVLSVVGIAHHSALNVRETPGGPIVGKLDSLDAGIVPTGEVRQVSEVYWHEVQAADISGWASGRYLAPLGVTTDITAQIIEQHGSTPTAESITEMGELVARLMASEEPESRIRISGAPVTAEAADVALIGEITVDVTGQPDDSIRGFRLLVVAESEIAGEDLELVRVESTVMCYIERGVSAEGRCN